MPRNAGEPDPMTWKASGNRIWLDVTRRRAAGGVDRRYNDTARMVAEVSLGGPAGKKLAELVAEALNQARLPSSLLNEFRRAGSVGGSR